MDKVVLEQTINKYADMVYRILFCHLGNKADSDDAFQDVFIKLYKYYINVIKNLNRMNI